MADEARCGELHARLIEVGIDTSPY